MIGNREIPDDAYWVEVNEDRRIHPYGMFKKVNRRDVEVTNSVSTDEGNPKRWVLIYNEDYEVWVKKQYENEYGYALQPDEQVSQAAFEAIGLKHQAMQDGAGVTLEEVSTFADSDEPTVLKHALIAAYYVAKTDPDVPDSEVDKLREQVREHTGHVDLQHIPTVLEILGSHLDEGPNEETG